MVTGFVSSVGFEIRLTCSADQRWSTVDLSLNILDDFGTNDDLVYLVALGVADQTVETDVSLSRPEDGRSGWGSIEIATGQQLPVGEGLTLHSYVDAFHADVNNSASLSDGAVDRSIVLSDYIESAGSIGAVVRANDSNDEVLVNSAYNDELILTGALQVLGRIP